MPSLLSSSLMGLELPETRHYFLLVTTYRQRGRGTVDVLVRAAATGQQCSGFIGYPECPAGQFCDIAVENACGGADLPGYCRVIPEVCTRIYAPVCGCDGRTYGNDCERQAAQVQLDHRGPCAGGEGAPCGGLLGYRCAEGLWCRYPVEAMCGAADATGVCTLPALRFCVQVYDPVCGCDGQTYPNQCHADNAQASVAYLGECNP